MLSGGQSFVPGSSLVCILMPELSNPAFLEHNILSFSLISFPYIPFPTRYAQAQIPTPPPSAITAMGIGVDADAKVD